MFEKENRFYEEHEEELLKRYEGRWLVIVEDHLDADFSSSEAGYYYGIARHGEGNFMLRHCVKDRHIIMNRVVF